MKVILIFLMVFSFVLYINQMLTFYLKWLFYKETPSQIAMIISLLCILIGSISASFLFGLK